MSKPKVFIDGQAGTTGLQIHQQLAHDSSIEILEIAEAERKDEAARKRLLNAADVVILCLPDDAAKQAVSWIENKNVRVLDSSSAHRTAPGWIYGFPELCSGQAKRIAEARLVSNPGCYATGAIALLHPLVANGTLTAGAPISVNAIRGYSGGGNKMIAEYEALAAQPAGMPVFYPYGLNLQHKHVKEMQQHSGLSHPPLFAPAVGPYRQGMLVEVPLQLWTMPGKVTPADLHEVLAAHYENSSVVTVSPLYEGDAVAEAKVDPQQFNDTNHLEISVFGNPETQQALLMARFDNLGKGASGAAIQNLTLMLGL